jgi:maltose/moltooligosaccharide transporter
MSMPKTMIQLAFVQYFTWFALFCMWIYATSAITSHVYGTNDPTSSLYNEGADWVGLLMAIYNGIAAPAAFILPFLAARINRKAVHMIALLIGGISLSSIYMIQDPLWLLLPFVGIGIAWASTLTMPYAILAGSLPESKMGVYMGIFNFFIVIPQITAASILGFLMRNVLNNEPIGVIVLGGVSMIVAGLLSLWVDDVDDLKSTV